MAKVKTIEDFIKFINKITKRTDITKDTKLSDLNVTDEQKKALFTFVKSQKKGVIKDEDFNNINTCEDIFNLIFKK